MCKRHLHERPQIAIRFIQMGREREREEEYECTAQFFLLFADKKFSDKVRNDLLVTFMIGRISVLFEKLIT